MLFDSQGLARSAAAAAVVRHPDLVIRARALAFLGAIGRGYIADREDLAAILEAAEASGAAGGFRAVERGRA